jgi:drug/metabolite transporter (DMT)-like permease
MIGEQMTTLNGQGSYLWLAFTLMTVAFWGLYGLFLHTGQTGMADPVNGRYKAFLIVGLAYFLTAVLAPIAVLVIRGAAWTFPVKGLSWSLLAGLVGAAGAFCVLLAFGAKGTPATVMTIVFAGAPIINAVVALLLHPPAGGFKSIKPAFFLGIGLAVLGAALVTLNKPKPSGGPPNATNPIPAGEQAHK